MSIKYSVLALAAVLPAKAAARETTSASAPVAGADVLGPSVSSATVRGPGKNTDLGALENRQREASQMTCPTECPYGSVVYCYGAPVGPACGNDCCTSKFACQDFTGCVKKDGSCAGEYACAFAFAPDGIEDSCQGRFACAAMGTDGVVGKISNSCKGSMACMFMGEAGAIVGKISYSCNADRACHYLGAYYGKVGTVNKSCNAKEACMRVGSFYSTVKSIGGSCNSEKQQPCRQLAASKSSKQDVGNVIPFKRNGRMKKYRSVDIGACSELCVDTGDDCKGIKWRQGVQKPCRIFKGGFSGKCGKRDLCITL